MKKNYSSFFILCLFAVLFFLQGCDKATDNSVVFREASNLEITVPNGNHWFTPAFEGGACNCPTGWCHSYTAVNFFEEGLQATVKLSDERTMKITLLEENDFEWESFEERILEAYGENAFEEQMDYYRNQFKVATEVEVDAISSEKILSTIGMRGDIIILPGQYRITRNEETPFGSFNLSISIQ